MTDRKLPLVRPGFQVFLADGADAFGAVRDVILDRGVPELLVNVENAGDFRVPLEAVEKVVGQKVVVRYGRLDRAVRDAISHALDQEDFPPPGGEVPLVPPPGDEDAEEFYADQFAGFRNASPPDELPGRDVGSRYGAPPSITTPRRRH